jgi:N-acetylneuraminate synthase/N,N'-diacetyllegionaminate synthase
MHIGHRQIHRDGPPLIMAEIGVNHDGSVEKGMKLVEAAAAATADAVKFQLFRADLLLAKQAGLVDYQKSAADSADDLLEPLQLSREQMQPLVLRAKELGMAAVVTPFSPDLVADCVALHVDAIKLASPDLVNRPLLEEAIVTGLPLILSTGAADIPEIERTVGWLFKHHTADRAILLHCVSSYPTPPEKATLGAIAALRARFPELPIGYSDHTAETFTAAIAVGIGACLLEKHLTLDRTAKGPDHAASLEPAQFAEYAAIARIGYAMRGPFMKQVLDIERPVREQTRQSLVARIDLPAGTLLTRDHLTVKRPGTGIPAADFDRVIGRTTAAHVSANSVLTWKDLGTDGPGGNGGGGVT